MGLSMSTTRTVKDMLQLSFEDDDGLSVTVVLEFYEAQDLLEKISEYIYSDDGEE